MWAYFWCSVSFHSVKIMVLLLPSLAKKKKKTPSLWPTVIIDDCQWPDSFHAVKDHLVITPRESLPQAVPGLCAIPGLPGKFHCRLLPSPALLVFCAACSLLLLGLYDAPTWVTQLFSSKCFSLRLIHSFLSKQRNTSSLIFPHCPVYSQNGKSSVQSFSKIFLLC